MRSQMHHEHGTQYVLLVRQWLILSPYTNNPTNPTYIPTPSHNIINNPSKYLTNNPAHATEMPTPDPTNDPSNDPTIGIKL